MWKILEDEYRKLGFDRLGDEIFEAPVHCPDVEPTSN